MTVRPPAVAGAFYPANAARLTSEVDRLLAGATTRGSGARPVAVVVPHAGYLYSGAVAAVAYRHISRVADSIHRVAIIGPAHFVRLDGAALPKADAWTTPLGTVPIDGELRYAAIAAGAVADDRPHAPEHSIEVQLPFLQRVVPDGLSILPVAVSGMAPDAVADLMSTLRTVADLLVVSTDLSHHHPDDVARGLDRQTVEAVLRKDPAALGPEAACGIVGLRGVAELARREWLTVTLLDQRTSADAGGDPRSVVGYAALAVS